MADYKKVRFWLGVMVVVMIIILSLTLFLGLFVFLMPLVAGFIIFMIFYSLFKEKKPRKKDYVDIKFKVKGGEVSNFLKPRFWKKK